MSKSILLAAIAIVATSACIGCNQPSQSIPTAQATSAGIAIIDLDEVARQLGSDKQIVTAIKQRQAALNSKLSEMAQAYTAEFKRQKEAMANETNEEGVQLATYQKQVSQSFNNAKAQAQQNLSQHRLQLVKQFRDAVRPAARKVANQRGLHVIVTKQDGLLYDYSPEHDITTEVVELLRASSSARQPAAAKPQEKQS